jgi:pimeloyl-ACP methyl ester carboxylesterase
MTDINVDEWVLAGHSTGAAAAWKLTSQMKPGISKLVMCGIGSRKRSDYVDLSGASVDVMVINGSNDKLVYAYSKKNRQEFRALLPPESGGKGQTSYVIIEGGNHAGFAHYGPESAMDGIRTITLEQQQHIFVQKIAEFLSREIGKK